MSIKEKPDMTGFDMLPSNPVLNFGKHKGSKLSEVPLSYLCWLLTKYHGTSLTKLDLQTEAKSRGVTFDRNFNPVISLEALKKYINKTGDRSWGKNIIARQDMKISRRTSPYFDFLGNFHDPLNELVPAPENTWDDPEFDYGDGYSDISNM